MQHTAWRGHRAGSSVGTGYAPGSGRGRVRMRIAERSSPVLVSIAHTRVSHHWLTSNEKGLIMELPLKGIKVIDFTGVQAGPACTQLLAWFGADVLKVERTSGGDVTRRQLRDIPDVDALYFTMLNSNKRSLAIDTKTPEGLAVMEQLIRI